jgi:proline dehydrogenase
MAAVRPQRPPLANRALLALLEKLPKAAIRPFAARYIAGEELGAAVACLEQLAAEGFQGIVDLLGEDVSSAEGARAVAREYAAIAARVAERGLDCYVSVKPTHVGLRLSEDLALSLYRELAGSCRARGVFVRVEMEDASTTDATLRIFAALRREHENVGIVLQSRLLRTPRDVERLLGESRGVRGRLAVRLVKGIYLEPAAIAHVEPGPIREAYVALSRRLLEGGARVSFATHDELLADELLALARSGGHGAADYELQVLLGVREGLWREWKRRGQPVRVYVPFGPEWKAYSLRRMRKNPELLRAVARAALGLG